MDILSLIPTVYEKLMIFILVMTRISTLLTSLFVFRREMITARIVVSISGLMAVTVVLLNPQLAVPANFGGFAMTVEMVMQIFIGMTSGLLLNLMFETFVTFGQIVSTQLGLGFAGMIDPRYGSISNLTQFYMLVATILFFFLNGHLIVIKAIVESFNTLPLFHVFNMKTILQTVISYSGTMFTGGLMLAITLVIVLMLCNISLAVMTRFAPQFNLFSIGINMTLVLGLICAYLTFPLFMEQGTRVMQACFNLFVQLLQR